MKPETYSKGKSATLQSVADAAGVHRSTAARALDPQQSHRISSEVVERVRLEAGRQGYRRDAIAASLRTGRSRLIGVVLPDLANPVFAPILDGVAGNLAQSGYSMLVANGGTNENQQSAIVEELIARRVDGLILATATRFDQVLSLCLNADIPTVLINRGEDNLRVPTTVPDDDAGMHIAVEHLYKLGHRCIGHIAGPDTVSTGIHRRLAFEEAVSSYGLDNTRIITAAHYTRDAGQEAASEMLNRWPDLTAIAAGNDLLALGAYLELSNRGLSCPTDISITGFNDMPLVDMVDPPLTTIRVAQGTMGAKAAELLLNKIAEPQTSPLLESIPVELIIRASTKSIGEMSIR